MEYKCKRCLSVWTPRSPSKIPKLCPVCRRLNWDEPEPPKFGHKCDRCGYEWLGRKSVPDHCANKACKKRFKHRVPYGQKTPVWPKGRTRAVYQKAKQDFVVPITEPRISRTYTMEKFMDGAWVSTGEVFPDYEAAERGLGMGKRISRSYDYRIAVRNKKTGRLIG